MLKKRDNYYPFGLTFGSFQIETTPKNNFLFNVISLKETYLQMAFVSFSEYQSRAAISLTTDFDSYDDILLFENNPNRKIYDREIVEFYWSKSTGYVRLV